MHRIFFLSILSIQGMLIAQPLNITVSAKAAILMNAENGKILFAKNIDDQHSPASTTKIATCLMALQRGVNLEEQIKAPLECLITMQQKIKKERKYQDPPYRLEPDGTTYGVHAGEYLSMKDLLYGMMLTSGNDAANVVAYHLSHGDISAYVEDMNQYLKTIGCRSTQLYNPHGLHYPQHITTARDLALMGREAIKHPLFLEIMQTVKYERPKTNKQAARTIWTGNSLLKKGKFYYPKAFGIKTGYHSIAGNVFVAAAKDEHRVLISVVMHAAGREEQYRDTIKMFDAAFGERMLTRTLLHAKEHVFTTKVKDTRQLLKAALSEDLVMQYFPSEEEDLEPHLVWDEVRLPIKQGSKVGELHVQTKEHRSIKSVNIYAVHDIKMSIWRCIFKKFNSWKTYACLIANMGAIFAGWRYRAHWKKALFHQSE